MGQSLDDDTTEDVPLHQYMAEHEEYASFLMEVARTVPALYRILCHYQQHKLQELKVQYKTDIQKVEKAAYGRVFQQNMNTNRVESYPGKANPFTGICSGTSLRHGVRFKSWKELESILRIQKL